MMCYAGIGSRQTPEDVQARMTKLAKILGGKGYTLRSGGAVGADQAFERGSPRSEIFLARDDLPLWADVFTEHFHPAPDRLTEWPRKLMNRNAMQILGPDGNTPVDFVVCWTEGGKKKGGTAHTLNIAEYFGIPIYNLALEQDIDMLKSLIRRMDK